MSCSFIRPTCRSRVCLIQAASSIAGGKHFGSASLSLTALFRLFLRTENPVLHIVSTNTLHTPSTSPTSRPRRPLRSLRPITFSLPFSSVPPLKPPAFPRWSNTAYSRTISSSSIIPHQQEQRNHLISPRSRPWIPRLRNPSMSYTWRPGLSTAVASSGAGRSSRSRSRRQEKNIPQFLTQTTTGNRHITPPSHFGTWRVIFGGGGGGGGGKWPCKLDRLTQSRNTPQVPRS